MLLLALVLGGFLGATSFHWGRRLLLILLCFAHVGVPGVASHLHGFLIVSLENFALLNVLLEFLLPLLHIFVEERWRVGEDAFSFVFFGDVVAFSSEV